jgi:hypothetical protein
MMTGSATPEKWNAVVLLKRVLLGRITVPRYRRAGVSCGGALAQWRAVASSADCLFLLAVALFCYGGNPAQDAWGRLRRAGEVPRSSPAHHMFWPPSTTSFCPVMNLASSDSISKTALATSSG